MKSAIEVHTGMASAVVGTSHEKSFIKAKHYNYFHTKFLFVLVLLQSECIRQKLTLMSVLLKTDMHFSNLVVSIC